MAKRQFRSLNAASATGAGRVFKLTQEKRVMMHISGTFVGTVELEGSINGSAFVSLGTTTAIGFVSPTNADEVYTQVRANVTAFTSGNITADIAAD